MRILVTPLWYDILGEVYSQSLVLKQMTELQYTAASCLSPPVAGPILSAASVPLEFTTLRGEFKLPALGDQPTRIS